MHAFGFVIFAVSVMILFFRKYFSFSRREQRGLVVLLLIVALFFSLTWWGMRRETSGVVVCPDTLIRWEALESRRKIDMETREKPVSVVSIDPQRPESFPFDPNTSDTEELMRLGLSERTIKSILNYRKAGGRFYKPEDLAKIYSLEEEDFNRLKPFISIVQNEKSGYRRDSFPSRSLPVKKSIPVVELNTADTLQLMELPGIGPAFARRIVKYRERLGGFVSSGQLLEVYGMDMDRYTPLIPFLTVDTTRIRKIDLNQTPFKEMLRHPYMEYYIVKAIFEYRDRHKGYREVEDLKDVTLIYDELYRKLRPYMMVTLQNQY